MARLDEIAEGIATILVTSPVPEPLSVSLRGEGAAETTFLVRAIIDSCERRGSPLYGVRVDMALGADLLKQFGDPYSGYRGAVIEGSDALASEIEVFRFAMTPLD